MIWGQPMDVRLSSSTAILDTTALDVEPAQPVAILDRLLTRREVEVLTSLSKQMIYRKIAEGTFPKPVVISEDRNGRPTRVAWSALELKGWRDSRPRRVGGPCVHMEMRAA
jgi:predicted DNA-binding transcriptional regulator AlpA